MSIDHCHKKFVHVYLYTHNSLSLISLAFVVTYNNITIYIKRTTVVTHFGLIINIVTGVTPRTISQRQWTPSAHHSTIKSPLL